MKTCPDRGWLEQLLNNRLVDTELDELEQHVEACSACQQTLDELTEATNWGLEQELGAEIARDGREAGLAVDTLALADGAMAAPNKCVGRGLPTVAGYEIEDELGRGGMGVVYRARHIRLNRPCALKMILAGAHAGPDDVTRFVTEAEAIARIQHPSIVQIRHIGDADGLPFLELEYVGGGSLDQQLNGTPWPAMRAARLAEQVARGVAEAHREGIIHRDLKPSNVLLADDGTPKIGDFGLAKMLDCTSALTRTESVMGSPSYMAPEQAEGRAKQASSAVDVYAVGAIFYELLTGRPPFRGTTALETLEQVKTIEPVAPSRLVPGVPRDAETICLKCLEKEPGKRYVSALDLADDLNRYQVGEPIVARPPSAWQMARYWLRRNLRAALCVLAVGLVLGVLAGYAVYFRILYQPLIEAVDASYGRLPATPRPWLAALPRPEMPCIIAFGLAALLATTTSGLAIVLLARPQSAGADLSLGLAVGLVAAYVSLMCGGVWAFAGLEVMNAVQKRENVLAFKDDLLQRQQEPLADVWVVPELGELHREVYEPDWQEHRYPDLKGLSHDDQRRILYDKMVCDAMIGVQKGLLWAMPIYLVGMFLVPAVEALAAGSLWRRYRRPGPVTLAYVERIVPLALTLILGVTTVWVAALLRKIVTEDWFSVYERAYWPMHVALVVMVVAQVATWRGWSGSLRLFLHAAWIVLVIWARLRLP